MAGLVPDTLELWGWFALATGAYIAVALLMLRPGKESSPFDKVVLKRMPENQQMRIKIITAFIVVGGLPVWAIIWLVQLGLWGSPIVQSSMALAALYVFGGILAGAHYAHKFAATADLSWVNPYSVGHKVTFRHKMTGWAETGIIKGTRFRDVWLEDENGDRIHKFAEEILECTIINHSVNPVRWHTIELPVKEGTEDLDYWATWISEFIMGKWEPSIKKFAQEPKAGTYVVKANERTKAMKDWVASRGDLNSLDPQVRFRMAESGATIAQIKVPVKHPDAGPLFETELLVALSSQAEDLPISMAPAAPPSAQPQAVSLSET